MMVLLMGALAARAADTAAVDALAQEVAESVAQAVGEDPVATLVRAEGKTPAWFHATAFEGILVSKLPEGSFLVAMKVQDADKLVNASDSVRRRSQLGVAPGGPAWLLYVELHPNEQRVDADAELYPLRAGGEKRIYHATYTHQDAAAAAAAAMVAPAAAPCNVTAARVHASIAAALTGAQAAHPGERRDFLLHGARDMFAESADADASLACASRRQILWAEWLEISGDMALCASALAEWRGHPSAEAEDLELADRLQIHVQRYEADLAEQSSLDHAAAEALQQAGAAQLASDAQNARVAELKRAEDEEARERARQAAEAAAAARSEARERKAAARAAASTGGHGARYAGLAVGLTGLTGVGATALWYAGTESTTQETWSSMQGINAAGWVLTGVGVGLVVLDIGIHQHIAVTPRGLTYTGQF